MLMNYSDVEICLGKLLSEKALDLRETMHLVLSNRLIEIFERIYLLLSLEIETTQIEVSFNIIMII